jgi:hypothetical protein
MLTRSHYIPFMIKSSLKLFSIYIFFQVEYLAREKKKSDTQLSSMCKYNENLKQQMYLTIRQCEQKAIGIVPYKSKNSFLHMNDIINYISDILSKLLSSHLLRLSNAQFLHASVIDSSIGVFNPTSDLESMDCMTPDTEDSDSETKIDLLNNLFRDARLHSEGDYYSVHKRREEKIQ